MNQTDLDEAVALSQNVSWPHTAADWTMAFELGHGLVVEDAGRTVGLMMWWPQGAEAATLGLAIVAEDQQRRGIGRVLIDATLDNAGERVVSLCGTAEGLRLYERVGFIATGAVRQHQGISQGRRAADVPSLELVPVAGVAALASLDHAAYGHDRTDLLSAVLSAGEALGVSRHGALAGYSVCRPFGKGRVIGPVVASTTEDAEALTDAWLDRYEGTFVRVDTPATSGLSALLGGRGLTLVGEVVAMTRGTPPIPSGPSRRFALASQAFG